MQLIGHSRGSVVVSEAMQQIIADSGHDDALDGGYFTMTLLDPHPANNAYGLNASPYLGPDLTKVKSGILAAAVYAGVQFRLQDPPVDVPSRVNELDDLYQDTSAALIQAGNASYEDFLNLHGLSPASITIESSQTLVLSRDVTVAGTGHSEVHSIYDTNVVQTNELGSNSVDLFTGSPSPPSEVLSGAEVTSLTSAALQADLVDDPEPSILVSNDADLQTVTSAINGLSAQSAQVDIAIIIGSGTYSDVDLVPPSGVNVSLIGDAGTTVIVGHSPALMVGSGNVLASGLTLQTATDSPTVLVTGGSLVLRDDTIEESTGGDDAAFEITGGTADLGTSASPGGNTLQVNGLGEFIQNNTSNSVSTVGNTETQTGAGASVPDLYAVGSGPGEEPLVQVYKSDGSLAFSFDAYAKSFTGGVSVAVGDVNGDAVPDIITGAGAGGGPHVKVFDGAALLEGQITVIDSFYAYAPSFTGGVRVAAGDMNGDGKADIVTGAGPGGGPHVEVFSGADLSLLASFYAYAPTFTGGVFVAAGDINGDGDADVVTGAGAGGGPHVKAFDGAGLAAGGSAAQAAVQNPLKSFYAYDATFTGGVTVAAGGISGMPISSPVREFRLQLHLRLRP